MLRFTLLLTMQSRVFRKCGEKSKTSEHNPIFGNKTAGRGSAKLGSGRPISIFTPHFRNHYAEVCGKIRNPQAHRLFHAKKPQVEALQHSGVLDMFRICRILPVFASVAGRVHLYPRLDNGHNSQFRLHNKTPAGAKLLLPALACLLVLFSACAEVRFGPLRLRGLHAQLVADELECRGDGLVHIVVLVAA